MNRRTALFTPLALFTLACETPQECLDIQPPEVDELGVTWISEPGWEADAQMITLEEITEAEDAGVIAEVSPGCWEFAPGAHYCMVITDCGSRLWGRPLDELRDRIEGAGPDIDGTWGYTVADSLSSYGVFDDVAVRLRLRP